MSMTTQELLEKRDSPSAMMHWLHLYYDRLGFQSDETMLHLSMGLHIKNVLLQDWKVDGRVLICVTYTDKKSSFSVYQDELAKFVEESSRVEPDYSGQLDGADDIPDRWLLALLQDNAETQSA